MLNLNPFQQVHSLLFPDKPFLICSNITDFYYFRSNKCRFGAHKRLFKTDFQKYFKILLFFHNFLPVVHIFAENCYALAVMSKDEDWLQQF